MKTKLIVMVATGLVIGTMVGCTEKGTDNSEASRIQGEYETSRLETRTSVEDDIEEEITIELASESTEVKQTINAENNRIERDKDEYEEKISSNQEKYRKELVTVPNEKIVVKLDDEESEESYLVIKNENGNMTQYNITFFKSEADYITGTQNAKIFTNEILIQDDEAWYLESLSSYQPYEYGEDYEDCWEMYKDDIIE